MPGFLSGIGSFFKKYFYCNTQKTSAMESKVSSKVVNLHNVPAEVLQRITQSLDSTDYGNLRLVSKGISQKLSTFESMNNVLKSIPREKTRAKYLCRLLGNKSFRVRLSWCSNNDLRLALKNISVGPHNLFKDSTCVEVKYLPASNQLTSDYRVKDIISSYVDGLDQKIVSESTLSFSRNSTPEELWESQIIFRDELTELSDIEDFFSNFEHVFAKTKGDEKFVVAAMANELNNYWRTYPPNEIKKEDIIIALSKYTNLFMAGENARLFANNKEAKQIMITEL